MKTKLSDIFFVDDILIESCLTIISEDLGISNEDVEEAIISLIPQGVYMKKYSENSFVVRLDNKKDYEDGLLKLGAFSNQNLKGGPGYIFPMWAAKGVRNYIMGISNKNKLLKFPVAKKWDFETVTVNFPFSDITGTGMLGKDYKKIIPLPKDSSFIKEYFNIRNSFADEISYLPAEALFIVFDKFSKPKQDEKLEVYAFYRKGKGVYWIRGLSDKVDEKVESLFREYPQNPYGSYFHEKVDGQRKEVFFYRGDAD